MANRIPALPLGFEKLRSQSTFLGSWLSDRRELGAKVTQNDAPVKSCDRQILTDFQTANLRKKEGTSGLSVRETDDDLRLAVRPRMGEKGVSRAFSTHP